MTETKIKIKKGWDLYIPKNKDLSNINQFKNNSILLFRDSASSGVSLFNNKGLNTEKLDPSFNYEEEGLIVKNLIDYLYGVKKEDEKPLEFYMGNKSDCVQSLSIVLSDLLAISNEREDDTFKMYIDYIDKVAPEMEVRDKTTNFEYSSSENDVEVYRSFIEGTKVIFEEQYDYLKLHFGYTPFFLNQVKLQIYFYDKEAEYSTSWKSPIKINPIIWKKDSEKKRRLIALHEIFHHIQYSLGDKNRIGRDWFLEGCATWMEGIAHGSVSRRDKLINIFNTSCHCLQSSGYSALTFWSFFNEKLKEFGAKNPVKELFSKISSGIKLERAIIEVIGNYEPNITFDQFYLLFSKQLISTDWRSKFNVYGLSIEQTKAMPFNFCNDLFLIDKVGAFTFDNLESSQGSTRYVVYDFTTLADYCYGFEFSISHGGPCSVSIIKSENYNTNPINKVGDDFDVVEVNDGFIYPSIEKGRNVVDFNYLIVIVTGHSQVKFKTLINVFTSVS